MSELWTKDRVLSLAPDAASAKAGQSQAGPGKWPTLGRSDHCLWGEVQGSGQRPYQVRVDLSGPAFKCSCPSRKFPCKHALGLMLNLAEQQAKLPSGEPPDWVRQWLATRERRAEQRDKKASEPPKPIDAAAQAKRKFITLLSLSDEGAPSFDLGLAVQLSALGTPAFACTPDMFPDLMAAAINRQDVAQWAAERDILTTRAADGSS